MKKMLIGLSLVALFGQGAVALEWLTDVPTALERAKREDKAVLLDFTGSDWCGWCIKLKKEVFDQFAFAGYANDNLVMVEVDFPQHKAMSTAQLNANHALASKYGVRGYPTIILLNAEGRQLGQAGYMPGGPSAFIARIGKFPGMPHHGSMAPSAAPAPPEPAVVSAPAPKPAPRAAPVLVPVAPVQYGDLRLKGISGTGNRRMALINNETMMVGETAEVKSFEKTVSVTVKEIRDNSVVIVVNGESRELKLGQR